jgi:hypothetical protein
MTSAAATLPGKAKTAETLKRNPGRSPQAAKDILPSHCPRVKSLVRYSPCKRFYLVSPIRCKCWDCEYCARLASHHHRAKIAAANPTHFLTLTIRAQPSYTPLALYQKHRKHVSQLLKWLKPRAKITAYSIVLEFTKAGTPHWHIAYTGKYVPQHEISNKWQQLTGSYVVWIERVRNRKHAASYLTKYLTKSLSSVPKTIRRITYSRNHPKPQYDPPWKHWDVQRLPDHPDAIDARMTQSGYVKYIIGSHRLYYQPAHIDDAWRLVCQYLKATLPTSPAPNSPT